MMKKRKIAFQTLGCKLNFSETSDISRIFAGKNYEVVDFSEEADFYVINSCSVTRKAEKKCKTLINKAVKANPQACVAVIGCYSQVNFDELSEMPGVSLVLGNAEKFNLLEHLDNYDSLQSNELKIPEYSDLTDFQPSYSKDGRTRSFFKIQDGCDYFCAYCTIPLARGKSRSNNIEDTVKIAMEIAKSDVREVVLTGVNIGDFGKIHGESFYGLLKEIVKLDKLDRIRISSVEPDLLGDDIIELVAEQEKLMPHFHIPLQSGSDKVLKDMGRKYDTALFRSRIEKIRKNIPHACIAIDLIVGFPTETDELFNETYNLLEVLEISYVHVFSYSERDNTKAKRIPGKVPNSIKNQRSKLIHILSEKKLQEFYRKNISRQEKVLWEKENINGYMYGFTENYVKVKTTFDESKINKIANVLLNKPDNDGIFIVK